MIIISSTAISGFPNLIDQIEIPENLSQLIDLIQI